MAHARPIAVSFGVAGPLLAGSLVGCAAAPNKDAPPSVAGPAESLLLTGLLVALLILAGALAAAGFWTGRRTVRPPAAVAWDPRLVHGLIGGHDLARDEAVRGHIEQVLREVGVVALRPAEGAVVAADRMEIVGTAQAGPGGPPVGSVAEVVRAGWADGSMLLRPAQVVVFAGAEPPTLPDDKRELPR